MIWQFVGSQLPTFRTLPWNGNLMEVNFQPFGHFHGMEICWKSKLEMSWKSGEDTIFPVDMSEKRKGLNFLPFPSEVLNYFVQGDERRRGGGSLKTTAQIICARLTLLPSQFFSVVREQSGISYHKIKELLDQPPCTAIHKSSF